MKNPFIALLALILATAIAPAQSAPEVAKSGAPTALASKQSGLKISIAPTFRRPDDFSIELHQGDPHINIVLQNVSDKPLSIYEEWNSWGAYNLHLEINAIDGKTLPKPLVVSKGMMGWRANFPSTEMLDVGGVAVREVRLHLPKQIFAPKAPLTAEDLNSRGPFYFNFPFPPADNSRTLTMRAVFENAKTDGSAKLTPVWTGKVTSPWTQYRFFWGTQ